MEAAVQIMLLLRDRLLVCIRVRARAARRDSSLHPDLDLVMAAIIRINMQEEEQVKMTVRRVYAVKVPHHEVRVRSRFAVVLELWLVVVLPLVMRVREEGVTIFILSRPVCSTSMHSV